MSYVVIAILSIAATVIVLALGKPDIFRVSREITIRATPDTVLPHINTLRKWKPWSPWAKLDPAAQENFEGPESGVGSKMSWNGNAKVGQGSMTVTESKPDRVRFQLDFVKPMKATNTAQFQLKPEGGATRVVWSMEGPSNFIQKVMSVVMNCEKMVSKQFDEGLASLKSLVEGA